MASKKIIIGTAGVVGLMGFFAVLLSFGLVITSDGDKSCAGTFVDPCISYINITNPSAKTVYIQSGSNTSLFFSENLADYQLYYKYKDKWKYVDFTLATRKIGLKGNDVFSFPARSTTEFKLVGYKMRTTDTVKWSFASEKFYLDPAWNGTAWTYNSTDLNVPYLHAESTQNATSSTSINCTIYANWTAYKVNYTNGTNYTTTFSIFNNDLVVESGNIISNGTPNIMNYKVNTTIRRGDILQCRVRMYDTSIVNRTISSLLTSNELYLNNSIPSISIISPANNSLQYISNNYPVILTWNGTDVDNDTLNYEVYGNNSLIYNGTSNTYSWINATNMSTTYQWFVRVSDNYTTINSSVYNFSVSFINWSITYSSPNIQSIEIKPTSSTGTFYPTNQSSVYGLFNVTNYEGTAINVSVNMSKGLSRYISLYFYNSTNITIELMKLTYPEPLREYNKFSTGKTSYSTSFTSGSSFTCAQTNAQYYNSSCPYTAGVN